MSGDSVFDGIDSAFDSIFGKGGALDGIFGKGGTAEKVFKAAQRQMPDALERDRYNEALMTELLTTLAGKKIITNDDARDMIAKAKERVKKKAAEDEKKTPTRPQEAHGTDTPCGGTCPLHDKRPHKDLECRRCRKVERHLIEDYTARCRVCLTARAAT